MHVIKSQKSKVKNFLLALVLLFSCSEDEKTSVPELVVGREEMSFSREVSSQKLGIKSNVQWAITNSELWCTVSPASGEAGTFSIDVEVLENQTILAREAILTITAQGLTESVTVKQGGLPFMVAGDKVYMAGFHSETISITIDASEEYSVSFSDDWITASTVSDTKRDYIIAANNELANREGSITFSYGTFSETVTIVQSGAPLTVPADKTGVESDAAALAAKMLAGWNAGNSLEACSSPFVASETMWGNPPISQTLIDAVKAAGFNAIRIPCAWSGYIEDRTTHRIRSNWLARVKEVVDYAVEAGMYAIINIHWDGGWLEENPVFAMQESVNEKQKALWEQIAVYFRDYDERLLFAGTNEVRANYGTPTTEHVTVQMSYNKTFVDAVRSTGGKNAWRNLIVQAYNTNIDHAVQFMEMPIDNVVDRLMLEVHYYDPYYFTINETSIEYLWGKDFADRSPNVSNWGQEDWADAQFDKMKTNFIDKGIPVILGEYSATFRANLPLPALNDHIKSRHDFLYYITKSAHQRGLVPFYWDNGSTGNFGSGLFNRATGEQVHSEAIKAIMDGAKHR